MTHLALSAVAVEFGATTLLENVSITVGKGDRWGIVGRNGTGKTTLFRLITGDLAPTRGTVARAPGLRITLLEQHRNFGDAATVWEAAAGQFAELLVLEKSLAEQAERIGERGALINQGPTAPRADEESVAQLLARYDRDLERFGREGGYTIAPRVDAVLHGLGFDPAEARTRPLERLSGGERGRLGLARQLVAPADVLLLDEPTNHLDLDTTRWLEQYLRGADETVLLISHDRDFLESVVDHVLHLEAGTAFAYAGAFSDFVAQRAERRLAQQRAFQQQRRVVAKEEEYIRRNIAGQNSRQAKGRRTRLARLPRLSPPPSEEDVMALRIETPERGGDQVLVAEGVRLAVPRRVLVEGFTARANRGDVIGLVGPNGAGKTTLLRAIVGEHPVDAGTLRLGASVTPAYYRQDLAQVPTDRTLYDIINDLRPAWGRGQVQGHLGRFGFSGDEVQRTASTLSGGERSRVALAMIVLARANFLLLDEPTNHLDVESIEALEDALGAYPGTVLLVSHDRALLRALTTRVWVLHDRRITVFDGSFAEWETVSAEREHAAAVAAAEEEELRRVRERQKLTRGHRADGAARAARRTAQRELEAAEARVTELEARVSELTAALGDPALYTAPDGARRAAELGVELDRAQRELEEAFARWEAATAAVEASVPNG